jgi:hypothetical protein
MNTTSGMVARLMFARLGGVAAVLGGVLWTTSYFVQTTTSDATMTPVTMIAGALALFMLGTVGLYVRCRGRLGRWQGVSRTAFVTSLTGVGMSTVGLLGDASISALSWFSDLSWWLTLFGFFLLNLGLVFGGNSVLQSRIMGAAGTLLLGTGIVGVLLILVGPWAYPGVALWVLYGFAWAVLGIVLMRPETQPASS